VRECVRIHVRVIACACVQCVHARVQKILRSVNLKTEIIDCKANEYGWLRRGQHMKSTSTSCTLFSISEIFRYVCGEKALP
jgi:hypothetical protein